MTWRARHLREKATALLQGRAVCGRCGKHFRVRYAARRGRLEAWYVCDRAHGYRGEPVCQSIAGPPVDKAIGMLIAEADDAVRRRIGARESAGRSKRGMKKPTGCAAARSNAPKSKPISPSAASCWSTPIIASSPTRSKANGTTSSACWPMPAKIASAHESTINSSSMNAVRERLIAMTVDFKKLWADPDTPNRERKRLLAHVIEDVTLVKLPAEGTTKVHVRFKGGKIQTLTTMSPKSSAQQVKTQPGIVELVDKLLDNHVYSEIAELLNQQGYRPGEAARARAPRRPLHRPNGSPISSTNTTCARAMIDCESAEC